MYNVWILGLAVFTSTQEVLEKWWTILYGMMFEVQTWERDKLNLEGICPIRVTAMLRYWQIDELLLGKSLLPFDLFCCSFANVVCFCWSMIDDLCKHAIFFCSAANSLMPKTFRPLLCLEVLPGQWWMSQGERCSIHQPQILIFGFIFSSSGTLFFKS